MYSRPDSNETPWHPDSVYLAVVYSVSERDGFKTAAGTVIWANWWNESGALVSRHVTVPEDSGDPQRFIPGTVAFGCGAVWGGGWVPDTDLVQGRWKVVSWETNENHCGQVVLVEVKAQKYLPWRLLNLAAATLQEHFGYTRGRIEWDLNFDPRGGSKYNSIPGFEKITPAWRPADARIFWTAAHEYGHALHHKALGGIWWRSPNCSPHSLVKPSSYRCALKEGFADYAGTVGSVTAAHPEGYLGDCLEHFGTPRASRRRCRDVSHDRKPEIEGWVAAFFMDLVDGNNEQHDWTEYPGR